MDEAERKPRRLSRQSGSRQLGQSGRMVEVNWYENRTNVAGSRFLATNIHLGRLHGYAKLDWFRWPDHDGQERSIEVRWHLIGIGGHAVRFSWRAEA